MEPRPRHSHVCKWLIVALLALISLIPWSSRAKAADLEKGTPLQLEVIINGQKTGLLASFVRLPDGKMAARRAELVEVGIDIAKAAKADDLIALDDLLSYHFKYDEPTQSISFDLDDNQRVARTFNAMGISAPRAPVSADWGSVLNYTLFGSETTGLGYRQPAFSGGSATLDARAFSPYGTLSQTG